jgi:enoyl-[acyl-carrier-protein] reductase (NADH)
MSIFCVIPPLKFNILCISSGCDQGIGHQLALHLDSLGMRVFAGCLLPGGEGEKQLKAKASERLSTVPLDVTKKDSVKAAAEMVKRQIDEGGNFFFFLAVNDNSEKKTYIFTFFSQSRQGPGFSSSHEVNNYLGLVTRTCFG